MKQNELISKKHKKVYKTSNYTEHLRILASKVTEHVLFLRLLLQLVFL